MAKKITRNEALIELYNQSYKQSVALKIEGRILMRNKLETKRDDLARQIDSELNKIKAIVEHENAVMEFVDSLLENGEEKDD